MESVSPVRDHDPNLCRNMGEKTFVLTFRLWHYSVTETVTVGGNCAGFINISSALYAVLEEIEPVDEEEPYTLVLTAKDGEELIEQDENNRDIWLFGLLVSATMTDLQPERKVS